MAAPDDRDDEALMFRGAQARKRHRCYECHRAIEHGVRYLRVDGKWYAYAVLALSPRDLLPGLCSDCTLERHYGAFLAALAKDRRAAKGRGHRPNTTAPGGAT